MMSEENIKKLCVTQRGDKFYYPRTIPQQRSTLPTVLCVLAMLVILTAHFMTSSTKTVFLLGQYANGFLVIFFGEILYRIFLILEEEKHLISRYESKPLNLLKDTFKIKIKVYLVLVVTILYSVYFLTVYGLKYEGETWEAFLFVMPTMYFLKIVTELSSGPLYDSYWIEANNGLDYGSGMAYSFFHGYLKFILPKHGNEDKNIEEQIKDYEDEMNVQFGAHKIFILIPKSLQCYVMLSDCSEIIEMRKSLKEKLITVAGVRERVYKNSVYSIETKTNKKVYVCAEYATPLKTFKDVFYADGDHNEYYKKHKNDILLQFYLTLKSILEHNHWDEYCELLYYEDIDKNNKPYDVGKIILSRMKELRKQSKLAEVPKPNRVVQSSKRK